MNNRQRRRDRRLHRRSEEQESLGRYMLFSTVTVLMFAAFFAALAFSVGFRFEHEMVVYSVGLGLTFLSFWLIFFGFFQGWSALTGPNRSRFFVVVFGVVSIAIPIWLFTQIGGLMDTGYKVTPPPNNPARLTLPLAENGMVSLPEAEAAPYLLITPDEVWMGPGPVYRPFKEGPARQIRTPSDLPRAAERVDAQVAQEHAALGQRYKPSVTIAISRDAPYGLLRAHLAQIPNSRPTKLVVSNGRGAINLHRTPAPRSDVPVFHVTADGIMQEGRTTDLEAISALARTATDAGVFAVQADHDVPVQRVVDVLAVGTSPEARNDPVLVVEPAGL